MRKHFELFDLLIAGLIILLLFFFWALSPWKRTDYPLRQELASAGGVEITSEAQSHLGNAEIAFTENGNEAILLNAEDGLFIKESRRQLKDSKKYSDSYWNQLVTSGNQYETVFIIDWRRVDKVTYYGK